MPAIASLRPILLSAHYAHPQNLEVQIHLKSGYRTCGLIEVVWDDGTTGLGEGYLAVFAPRVFEQIVRLLEPAVVGKDALDVGGRYQDMCGFTDYWSMQGAARHVISAVEIAMRDAVAKHLKVPAHVLLGGKKSRAIRLYGSGGDSPTAPLMQAEIDQLKQIGIDLFKIRARKHEAAKSAWVLEKAARAGMSVGIDMAQNLANPAQTVADVLRFVQQVAARSSQPIAFLEEPLGPMDFEGFRSLRARGFWQICGGETLTTAAEMCQRIRLGCYDFAQPDATVIGGMGQVMEVFAAGRQQGMDTVVHCWGGAVGMMANYHCAFAGGGQLAELPMPAFPLREALLVEPLRIDAGRLQPPTCAGLGVHLTPQIERQFSFREDAVYQCAGKSVQLDETWSM